jgi:hypothetical protein
MITCKDSISDSIYRESFTSQPLKVVVGDGATKKIFYVNKEVICHESEFFRTACKEEWSINRRNTVTLAEDKPQLFCIFLAWLQTGDIEQSADILPLDSSCPKESTDEDDVSRVAIDQFELLCRCFFLADSLQSNKFCDCIMDRILDLSSRVYQNSSKLIGTSNIDIKLIYRHTTCNSPLRKFCLDGWLSGDHDGGWITRNIKSYIGNDCDDFLADLIPRLFTLNSCQKDYPDEHPRLPPWEREKSYYHQKPIQQSQPPESDPSESGSESEQWLQLDE